jgi:hypothetical protein
MVDIVDSKIGKVMRKIGGAVMVHHGEEEKEREREREGKHGGEEGGMRAN